MEEQTEKKYIVHYQYSCDENAVVVKATSPAEAEEVVRQAHRQEIGEDYEAATWLVIDCIELVPDGMPVYHVDVKFNVGERPMLSERNLVVAAANQDAAKQKALVAIDVEDYANCGGVSTIEFGKVTELTGDEKACLHVSLGWIEQAPVTNINPAPGPPAEKLAPSGKGAQATATGTVTSPSVVESVSVAATDLASASRIEETAQVAAIDPVSAPPVDVASTVAANSPAAPAVEDAARITATNLVFAPPIETAPIVARGGPAAAPVDEGLQITDLSSSPPEDMAPAAEETPGESNIEVQEVARPLSRLPQSWSTLRE